MTKKAFSNRPEQNQYIIQEFSKEKNGFEIVTLTECDRKNAAISKLAIGFERALVRTEKFDTLSLPLIFSRF